MDINLESAARSLRPHPPCGGPLCRAAVSLLTRGRSVHLEGRSRDHTRGSKFRMPSVPVATTVPGNRVRERCAGRGPRSASPAPPLLPSARGTHGATPRTLCPRDTSCPLRHGAGAARPSSAAPRGGMTGGGRPSSGHRQAVSRVPPSGLGALLGALTAPQPGFANPPPPGRCRRQESKRSLFA